LTEAGFDAELYEFDGGRTITRERMEKFIAWVRRSAPGFMSA